MSTVRKDLPPLPDRMTRLPVDARGYPVPWFVGWVDDAGKPTAAGRGTPDFRLAAAHAIRNAVKFGVCWLCGERLGTFKAFVIGPMCAVNRVSSEPPSHLECADFAAQACPFLVRPNAHRRTNNLPEDRLPAAGCGSPRNPGVVLVWTTKRFIVRRVPPMPGASPGVLFQVGEPESLRWYCEARAATRAEVIESIDLGLPELRAMAEAGGPSDVAAMEREVARAMLLVPKDAE